MKPVNEYHLVPHKPICDCTNCKLLQQVQDEAFKKGHEEGYARGTERSAKGIKPLFATDSQCAGNSLDG